MNSSIYLRFLQLKDAQTSYQWRNNPVIWKYTGSKPDRYITPEMETKWIEDCLRRTDQKRFAICLKENDQYIGNIYLKDITDTQAEYSGIFIGDPKFWGKGVGYEASKLLVEYGFNELRLDRIYGVVHKDNKGSLRMLEKLGFDITRVGKNDSREVFITKQMFAPKNQLI